MSLIVMGQPVLEMDISAGFSFVSQETVFSKLTGFPLWWDLLSPFIFKYLNT